MDQIISYCLQVASMGVNAPFLSHTLKTFVNSPHQHSASQTHNFGV